VPAIAWPFGAGAGDGDGAAGRTVVAAAVGIDAVGDAGDRFARPPHDTRNSDDTTKTDTTA
jgi:hypothetical protein